MAQSASNNGSQAGTKYTLNNPNGVDSFASGGGGQGMDKRTKYALGEHDFLQSTGSTLDGYIALGQATMMNLGNQRDMLKGESFDRLRSHKPSCATRTVMKVPS